MAQQPIVTFEDPDAVRPLCRCPNPQCRAIWTHFEGKDDPHRGLKETVAYIKAHYGSDRPYQCPECGTWSVLRSRTTLWQRLGNDWRVIVPPPESAQARAGRDQEEEEDRG